MREQIANFPNRSEIGMHMLGQKSQREGEFDLCTERGKRPESFEKFRHSFVVHESLRDIFLQVLFEITRSENRNRTVRLFLVGILKFRVASEIEFIFAREV
jgi:hypothetical protein